jgi:endonuclease V-like protein UPF0215 family
MLAWRERLDEDPEHWFAHQEIGTMREYVVVLEGIRKIDEAKYIVKRALEVASRLPEALRASKLAHLCDNSELFKTTST